MVKKLGIVGGRSWASTALYYEQINRGVAQRWGLHSASLAIESLDLAPIAAMQPSGDWAGVGRIAAQAGKRLAASGVEARILASNTLHKVEDDIFLASGLPILNVADRIVAHGRTRIALLRTRFRMSEDFARDHYTDRGLTLHSLTPDWEREVDRIIYENLAAGRVVRASQRKLKSLITEFGKQKVQASVLGLTEFALAVEMSYRSTTPPR